MNLYITPEVFRILSELMPIVKNELPDLTIFTWMDRGSEESVRNEWCKTLPAVVSKDRHSTYLANARLSEYLTDGVFILDLEKLIDVAIFFHIKEDFIARSTFLFLLPSTSSANENIITALSSLKEILIQRSKSGNYIFSLKDSILVSRAMILTTTFALVEIHRYLRSNKIRNQIILQWFKRIYIVDSETLKWLTQTESLISSIANVKLDSLSYKVEGLRRAYNRLKQFIEEGSEYTKVAKDTNELIHLIKSLLDKESMTHYHNINPSDLRSQDDVSSKVPMKTDLFTILIDRNLEEYLDVIVKILNEKTYRHVERTIPTRGIYIYYNILLPMSEVSYRHIEYLLARYKPYLNEVKRSEDFTLQEYRPYLKDLPIIVLNQKTLREFINIDTLHKFDYLLKKLHICINKLTISPSHELSDEKKLAILEHLLKYIEDFYAYYVVLKIYAIYKLKGKRIPNKLHEKIDKIIDNMRKIHEVIEESAPGIKDNLDYMEVELSGKVKPEDIAKITNFMEDFKSMYDNVLRVLETQRKGQ